MNHRTLTESIDLFRSVKHHFSGPGIERGGHERPNVTPVFVKKWGAYLETLYPDVDRFTVEASYTAEQFTAINHVLSVFTQWCEGGSHKPALVDRIITVFLEETKPFYLLALLNAIKATISDMLEQHPEHGPAMQAAFCVAGSEGIRDLVRMYCAHHLEHALEQSDSSLPDVTAFINLHQRDTQDGLRTQYEVWCPGQANAKVIFHHSWRATQKLTSERHIAIALSLAEEVARLPLDITRHLNEYVENHVNRILKEHNLTWS